MALSHGAVGWSAVCDCVIPDHTNLNFVFGPCFVIQYLVPVLVLQLSY